MNPRFKNPVGNELVYEFYKLLYEHLGQLLEWVEGRMEGARMTVRLQRHLFEGNHARFGYDELVRFETVDWEAGTVRIYNFRDGETKDWTLTELEEDMWTMSNQDEGYWFESEAGPERFWSEG